MEKNNYNRRQFIKMVGLGALALNVPVGIYSSKTTQPKKKMNILFIAVDDLRPELGCYGNTDILSPNIDQIADEGFVFNNSFCQVPVCGASRASLLSGLRPNRKRFLDFDSWLEKDAPGITSLPKNFKDNGYYTISNGKVFHHKTDCQDSWSEPAWSPRGHWRDYQTNKNIEIASVDEKKFIANSYEQANVDNYTYIDGKVTRKSINDLKKLSAMNQPFFMAVGYRKPHLPFNAPRKFWDIYDEARLPEASNPYIPKNAPLESIHNSFELRAYKDIPDVGDIPKDKAKKLKHGYYACVTYIDFLIGELLNELKSLDLYDKTIIVLWGDHGYQLGEHTLWCKHSNYETSLKAPLIIRVPGIDAGVTIDGLTEFVDIYPSLCDLAGLSQPDHLEGDSLVPLLAGTKQKLKKAVFSRFIEGESVRTERYLYTEYINKAGELKSRMLYDHASDPQENINIVYRKENKELVSSLSELLTMHRKKYYH